MPSTARVLGLARSLAMYYGIPLRAGRLARFYSEFVGPGALCFDVGAHVGNRIRCWRRLGARVVAVEPQRDCFAVLRRLYGSDPMVVLEPVAAGRRSGTAPLFVSDRTPTVTTLSSGWVRQVQRDPSFAGVEWHSREDVPVTTLEALIERHGTPSFVKIDVEGYEAETLAGLERPVRALSFEYLPAARDIALECIDRLETLGRYRYNWSRGETHRFVERDWLTPAAMRDRIAAFTIASGSGDVYARLNELQR